jgi:hypothetical protein
MTRHLTYKKSTLTYVLCGAAGFGVGGTIGATAAVGPLLFIFPIMGIVGGASIGLLLGKRVSAIVMAVAGAVGFGIASIPVLVYSGLGIGSIETGMVIPTAAIIEGTVILFVLGAVQGLIGGISLGIDLRDRTRARYLIAGSTIGFAIGAQASWGFVFGLSSEIIYAIWGAIGGATLGAALGYLEKRKVRFHEVLSWKPEQTTWTNTTTFRVGIFLNLLLLIINWVNAMNIRIGYYNEVAGVITPTGVTEFRMPNLLTFIALIGVTIGLNILMIIVLIKDKERRHASILGALGLLAVLLPLIGGLCLPPAMTPN